MTATIAIAAAQEAMLSKAQALAARLQLPMVDIVDQQYAFLLVVTLEHLELRANQNKQFAPLFVDFIAGAMQHRHRFGGGRGQLIAKACGLKKSETSLRVVDLTAGLGHDAFVLAYLGCDVTLVERSPIVAALLEDGLERARAEPWVQQLQLTLVHEAAQVFLKKLSPDEFPDVIYIDPMYPKAKKSALNKKAMRMLRDIVGDDRDASELLTLALPIAKKRVVVKRAKLAPTLATHEPDLVYRGKSSRYDVFIK